MSSTTTTTNPGPVRRPLGITRGSYDEEAMAGHVRRLNVDTDVGMVTDPTAIGMKGDKGLPESAIIAPMDLTSLSASDGTPLRSEMTSRVNTPKTSSLPNLPPNQTSQNEAPFPKLFIGAIPPLFTLPTDEAAINSSPFQPSSQDNNVYVEEDEKEQDEGQLVPPSLRDIESGPTIIRPPIPMEGLSPSSLQLPSLNQHKFVAPRVYMPVESRHFDVSYGYAEEEEEEERMPSSSTSDISSPKVLPPAPIVRPPMPPPDIIPPSLSVSPSRLSARLSARL